MKPFTITGPAEVLRKPSKGDLIGVDTAEHGYIMYKVTVGAKGKGTSCTAAAQNWPESPAQEVQFVIVEA